MPGLSLPIRVLGASFSRCIAALAAVPIMLVAAPVLADDCTDDADCGFGFSCETVVTSVASTGTGGSGVGGASATGGAAGTYGAAGAAGGGALPQGGTTSFGGTSSFGGISGTAGTGVGGTSGSAGAGGTGSPPTACGNRFCETPAESPETCALDCAYTTVCATAPCTSYAQCAQGFVCPTEGGAGGGGAPGTAFCGDLLCTFNETATSCAVDCDPQYRRCLPGSRGCQTNADCGPGWT